MELQRCLADCKHADGAIVGSALVETMEKKQDIIQFLEGLRKF